MQQFRISASLIYLNNISDTPMLNMVYIKQLLEKKLWFDSSVANEVLGLTVELRSLVMDIN